MGIIQVRAFKCERCGQIWTSRNTKDKPEDPEKYQPKVCPKCKSPYWNTPRKKNS
jgi:DNA-directed RNA polymerase subunit RPC12/RpoP